jgi:predicted RNase H-like HicB family nuclease
MNDEEALQQINEALALWFDGKQDPIATLNRIAQITGENTAA